MVGFLAFFWIVSLISSTFAGIKRKLDLSILPDAEGRKRLLSRYAPAILQIDLCGVIGTDDLNLDLIENQLVESQMGELRKGRVKGILLYIDSPGGSAKDSDAIYRRLKAYKEKTKIPIYAYVDGYCASGGIFAACAADKIFSSPSSVIGSVGVRLMTPFLNVYKVLQKWDIDVRTFAEGKHKDHLNPFRPWQEDEDSDLRSVLSQSYDRFVDVVVSHRPRISREQLTEEYGAQIYSAAESARIGFIDEGGSDYALALSALVKAAGIEESYQVVELVKKRRWFKEMMENSFLLKGKVRHEIDLGPYSSLSGQIAYLFLPLRF